MSNHKKITIAIDGPAGSGKSTTARRVAEHLGYVYVDTGAMYRAFTLLALRNHVKPGDSSKIEELVQKISIQLLRDSGGIQRTLVNDEDVSEAIRSQSISENVSYYSSIGCVRTKMVEIQREIGKDGGIVMDGRDIGTVVFPNAELKIFLIASIDVRAQRRLIELKANGKEVSLEEIRKNIYERDVLDSERSNSPLRKALDAVEIDTSSLTIQDQTKQIIVLAEQVLEQNGKSHDSNDR